MSQLSIRAVLPRLGLFLVLCFVYTRIFGAYSQSGDSANGYLRALDFLQSGNYFLKGWLLPIDTFWSSDFLLNVAFIKFANHGYALLSAVPGCSWAAMVMLCFWLADARLPVQGRKLRILCVSLLVGLPLIEGPSGIGFIIQAYCHAGSVAYIMAGMALAVSIANREGWSWALGLILSLVVGASTVGDPMVTILGWLPLLGTCFTLLCLKEGRDRRLWGILVATLVGIVGGKVVLAWFQSCSMHWQKYPTMVVGFEHFPRNCSLLVGFCLKLCGCFVFGLKLDSSNILHLLLAVVRFPILLAFAYVLVQAVRRHLVALDRVARRQPVEREDFPFVETLLVVGCLVNAAAVLTSHAVTDIFSERYMLPGLLYATALLARRCQNLPLLTPFLCAGLAATLLYYLQLAGSKHLWSPCTLTYDMEPVRDAIAARNLDQGFAEYWECYPLKAVSGGVWDIRAVSGTKAAEPYLWQAKFAWHTARFHPGPFFVLADSGRSDKLCAPGVIATFGEPRELVQIGHYELLIYDAENEALDRFRQEAAEREKAFDLEPR